MINNNNNNEDRVLIDRDSIATAINNIARVATRWNRDTTVEAVVGTSQAIRDLTIALDLIDNH